MIFRFRRKTGQAIPFVIETGDAVIAGIKLGPDAAGRKGSNNPYEALTLTQFMRLHPDHVPEAPQPTGVMVLEGGAHVFYRRRPGAHWHEWRFLRQFPHRKGTKELHPTVRQGVPTDFVATSTHRGQR